MVALLFTAEPEQAIALEKEAEDWEREAEEEWRAKCEQIRKEVMSMTKKQLQQCLTNCVSFPPVEGIQTLSFFNP